MVSILQHLQAYAVEVEFFGTDQIIVTMLLPKIYNTRPNVLLLVITYNQGFNQTFE